MFGKLKVLWKISVMVFSTALLHCGYLSARYHCPIIQNNFELPYYRSWGNMDAYATWGDYVVTLDTLFYEYANSHDNLYINDINYQAVDIGLEMVRPFQLVHV